MTRAFVREGSPGKGKKRGDSSQARTRAEWCALLPFGMTEGLSCTRGTDHYNPSALIRAPSRRLLITLSSRTTNARVLRRAHLCVRDPPASEKARGFLTGKNARRMVRTLAVRNDGRRRWNFLRKRKQLGLARAVSKRALRKDRAPKKDLQSKDFLGRRRDRHETQRDELCSSLWDGCRVNMAQ